MFHFKFLFGRRKTPFQSNQLQAKTEAHITLLQKNHKRFLKFFWPGAGNQSQFRCSVSGVSPRVRNVRKLKAP
jgi:hypothetical protein